MSRLLTAEEAAHFKETIEGYEPAADALRQFKVCNFAVIVGPAGAGKDTLRNSLTNRYPKAYLPILSTTTRPRRQGEIEGQTYHFTTIPAFNKLLMKSEFLQVALVHDQQLSGLHISEVSKITSQQWGLSILIAKTEAELRAYQPKLKTIFVIPPDRETLFKRINAQRMLDPAEIKRRLYAATAELTYALNSPHYYCLVSDTVAHIRETAHAYLQEDLWDKAEDNRARQAIREILKLLNK